MEARGQLPVSDSCKDCKQAHMHQKLGKCLGCKGRARFPHLERRFILPSSRLFLKIVKAEIIGDHATRNQ
jgi:hypothetical protein